MRAQDFNHFYNHIRESLANKDLESLHCIECGAYNFLRLTDRQVNKVFGIYKFYGVVGETKEYPNGHTYTSFGINNQMLYKVN